MKFDFKFAIESSIYSVVSILLMLLFYSFVFWDISPFLNSIVLRTGIGIVIIIFIASGFLGGMDDGT